LKTILQTETSECGLACLAMIADHFGNHVDLADLRRQFSISLKGATMAQILRHAGAMQMAGRISRRAKASPWLAPAAAARQPCAKLSWAC
jgi:ATP-binding cassette subfamily B protein RaxB